MTTIIGGADPLDFFGLRERTHITHELITVGTLGVIAYALNRDHHHEIALLYVNGSMTSVDALRAMLNNTRLRQDISIKSKTHFTQKVMGRPAPGGYAALICPDDEANCVNALFFVSPDKLIPGQNQYAYIPVPAYAPRSLEFTLFEPLAFELVRRYANPLGMLPEWQHDLITLAQDLKVIKSIAPVDYCRVMGISLKSEDWIGVVQEACRQQVITFPPAFGE